MRCSPLLLVPLLAACTETSQGPTVRLAGDGFWDAPFPSDSRTVDGHPDLSGFPGRDEFELVELYTSDIESLDGFSTNAPVWLSFDAPPDTSLLPDPADTVLPDSPILFVDVDPDSPGRGTLVPWTWAWKESATTFQPDRQLAIMPLTGSPLHPARTYAVVLTTDIASASGEFPEVFDNHHPDFQTWRSVGETLFQLGVDTDRVAAATQFTTQDAVQTVARTTAYMRANVSTPALDQPLEHSYTGHDFEAFEGQLWLPIWQHGDKPYTTQGGGFLFDEQGTPILYGWERVTFTFSVPEDEDMPAEGWPVVVYMHGTGGDHTTFANGSGSLEPASVLAREGMAGIGISLPLHGDRGTGADPALLSFNYFNPTAARGNFQQATLDALYMVELLTARQHDLALYDGDQLWGEALTDPDRVAYMGHSHGGVVGAMAAPWLGDRVPAVFLSGAGGNLSLAVQFAAADGIDIVQLIRDTFGLAADEELDAFHPLVGMVQTLGESVDPINYAPFWHDWQPYWDANPANVLATTGLEDEYTPTITAQVMAGAAGNPITDPVSQSQPVNELRGLVGQALPTADNVQAWDDESVSGGLVEFPDEGHFPIFTNRNAARLYQHFLATGLDGQAPEILLEDD